MNEKNILDKLLEEQNGYIRLVDVQNEGVSKYAALDYVRKKQLLAYTSCRIHGKIDCT